MRLIDADELKREIASLVVKGESRIYEVMPRCGGEWVDGIASAYREIDDAPTVSIKSCERMKLIQEAVDCIRNTFNRDTGSDKLVRNCMALLQNAIDGEYHDMEKVDVSELERPQGHWEVRVNNLNKSRTIHCSICDYHFEAWRDKPNFCPNCGAEMRGDDNESD